MLYTYMPRAFSAFTPIGSSSATGISVLWHHKPQTKPGGAATVLSVFSVCSYCRVDPIPLSLLRAVFPACLPAGSTGYLSFPYK